MSMPGDQPISFMFKPDEPKALEIHDRRGHLGIEDSYGWQRFHISLLPLGEGRHVRDAFINLLDQAVRSANLEPLRIELARLSGNAMIVGKGNAAICEFQRRLVRQLAALGISHPGYGHCITLKSDN
jgi:hypothetical protein